jgi:hypothetical protein
MKDPQIKIKQTDLLSDNHYILNKVTFDYQKMTILGLPRKRVYDRKWIYYFTTQNKKVILTRQFRLQRTSETKQG